MKLKFYHWGTQCPVIYETLELLETYKGQIDIEIVDISVNLQANSQVCQGQRMYFPFLTVFDEEKRWFRPLDALTLNDYVQGKELSERPYIRKWSNQVFEGSTQLLTADTVHKVKVGCTLTNCSRSCTAKEEFLNGLNFNKRCDFWGVLDLDGNQVVGGVEYVPSMVVPYDIPKSEETAFITCLYHSSEAFDYKSVPLRRLEDALKAHYTCLLAVTDEVGSFPNGNLEWFIRQGYVDLGIISIEENYCTLHLVKKSLRL